MSWEQNAIEVTKYNPKYRDANGVYRREEWTDYSDIGNKFNDKIFTLEEYETVETLYIKAARSFFEFYGCDKFLLNGRMVFYTTTNFF